MRRLLTLLCLLAVGCGSDEPGHPDGSWQTIELGTDAEFRDIFFLDAMNGWMVGAVGIRVPGGIVARTIDGGRTWQYRTGVVAKRSRTTSIDLNAVHFVDAMRGCVAAESGVILFTEDGGENWKRVPPTGPVYAHNRDMDFVDDRNGWIIGRQGVVHTGDGGATWRRVDEDGKMDSGNAIDFVNDSRGWVVGKFGEVHRTDDGGVTWKKVEALGNLDKVSDDEKPNLTSVHFIDLEHGWIAGYIRESTLMEQHDHAVIIHTSNGGRTWRHQLDGVESLLRSVRFADRRRGWAVGYNVNDGTSTVLATDDAGRNWHAQTTIHGEKLLALDVRDGHVWAVGDRVREEPQRLLRLVPPAGDGAPGGVQGVGESDGGQ